MPSTTSLQDPGRVGGVCLQPWERTLIVSVPAVWAAVLVFHPTGGSDLYGSLEDQVGTWQAVHVAMIALIPLMALALHRVLRGIDNPPASMSRVLLPVFAVSYGVFEAIMGIGTGILVRAVNDLPSGDRAVGAELVEAYADSPLLGGIELVASLSLGVALIAAAFALLRARLIRPIGVALAVVATPLIVIHTPPLGPVGLALLLVAMWPAVRS